MLLEMVAIEVMLAGHCCCGQIDRQTDRQTDTRLVTLHSALCTVRRGES